MPEELLEKARKGDLVMIRSAIRRGWKIPDEVMQSLPEKMAALVDDADPRTSLGAAKVLVAMHGQNQRDAPTVKHHEHHHELESVIRSGETIEQRKQRLAERIARLSGDGGGA